MSIIDSESPIVSKLEKEDIPLNINIKDKYVAKINGEEKIINIENVYNVRFNNKNVSTYISYSYEEEKKQNWIQKLFNFKKEIVLIKPEPSFYTSDFYSEFSPTNVLNIKELKF